MKADQIAVLTCDIVASTAYKPKDREVISEAIKQLGNELSSESGVEYRIFRGDSLQGLLHDKSQAMRHALYIKSYLKATKVDGTKRATKLDIRISIGIGKLEYRGDNVLDSDGEVFHLSGRTLDTMKKKGRTLTFTTNDEKLNHVWDVITQLLEEVMEQWTIPAAEIVWKLIKGASDKELQEELEISQPAVSQRKKHAGWEAILNTIELFEHEFKS